MSTSPYPEQLLEDVAEALHAEFPDLPIYKDFVPEDFTGPALYVKMGEVSTEALLNPRMTLIVNVEAHFFPLITSYTLLEDCRAMVLPMMMAMEYVGTPKTRGLNLSARIMDGGWLMVNAEYSASVRRTTAGPLMQRLHNEPGIREG